MTECKTIYLLETFDRWDEFFPWDVVGFVFTEDEAIKWKNGNENRRYRVVNKIKEKNDEN